MRPRRQTRETAGPKPETRELLIGGVGAQGDGVATSGPFVAGSLPGERVLAAVVGDRAELIEVLTPSAERVSPPCPHFGACGGCALQHWAREPYLAWKVEQIRLALARERIETLILPPFDAPPGSRRRLALHARQAPGGAQIGFKARRSWRLAPTEVCSIVHPALVQHFGGSGWRWTRVITFAYDSGRRQLMLRSDGGWSWHSTNPDLRTRIANRPQDFGRITFEAFSYNRAFESK